MSLPDNVIREDRELEERSSKAAEELMRLRWHWTLDESNPERVSVREYARAIGKGHSVIHRDANAYALIVHGAVDSTNEARERASMGAETWAATEAIAEARGLQPGRVRQSRPVEVRRVREIARERAEQHGTSVEEEAHKAAQWAVKAEQADRQRQVERKERLGLRFIAMEEHLTKAKRSLVEALNEAHEVPWGDEERELLADTVANVKALLNLIDLALVGAADVDWDVELARLTEVV